MAEFLLRLLTVLLFTINWSSQNEEIEKAILWESQNSQAFQDLFLPVDDVPPLNPEDAEAPNANRRESRSIPTIPFVNPGLFYNPFNPEAFNPVQAIVFDAIANQLRTDLEIAKQRQNVMLKYVECSSPKGSECKPVLARVEEAEDEPRGYWEWLASVNSQAPGTVTCPPCPTQEKPKGYWEWLESVNPTPPGSVPCACPPPKKEVPATKIYRVPTYWDWLFSFNRPVADVVREDKFYAVMAAFKDSIERLTVRQNMLYEYISCSCPSTTECGAALKPVLDLMFTNNQNITGEMIKDLMSGRRNTIIDTLFGWLPNFNLSSWTSFNPLSVLADLLKPTYAGAASYSTSGGHGNTYTVSSSGRPGTEHYVVHHPGGGTSHVSTSTSPGATSISVTTTDQKKETEEATDDVKKESTKEKKEGKEKTIDNANPEDYSKATINMLKEESPGSNTEEKRETVSGDYSKATINMLKKEAPDSSTEEKRETVNSGGYSKATINMLKKESPDSSTEEKRETVNSGDYSKATINLQTSKIPQSSSDEVPHPQTSSEVRARQLFFGGGPGMVHPMFAHQVSPQYTANPYSQPGVAAAGVGINQGLAAAQYTAG